MNKLMIVLAALCCLVSVSFASTDTGTGGNKSTDTGTGGKPGFYPIEFCQSIASLAMSRSTDTGTGGGKSTDTGTGGGKSTDTGTGGGINALLFEYNACLSNEFNVK